ncbi:MAG: hypothetical protein FWE36_06475 [Erysipelotrichales bacterium]|nr:hypothetical protein [Erysipelotrichales bacterium]
MMTILENDWDVLIESTDLVSVKIHALNIHRGFLMFFRTDEEFVLNDSGVVMMN